MNAWFEDTAAAEDPAGSLQRQDYEAMSIEEKKVRLYLQQKALLDEFLEKGAISRAQYEKSFGDLTEKMGMGSYKGGRDDG